MKTIHLPSICIEVLPNSPSRDYRLGDLWDGKMVFDSNRLEHDPRPRFKDMTIGDFDLYTATAFFLLNNSIRPGYIKAEVECNRIDRTFRIKAVGTRDGMSYSEKRINGNMVTVELMMNVLNDIFGLIGKNCIIEEDYNHIKYQIEDALSFAWRFHSHQALYNAKIGIEVAPLDVVLVLRKMLSKECNASLRSAWTQMARGKRMFATQMHPELLC